MSLQRFGATKAKSTLGIEARERLDVVALAPGRDLREAHRRDVLARVRPRDARAVRPAPIRARRVAAGRRRVVLGVDPPRPARRGHLAGQARPDEVVGAVVGDALGRTRPAGEVVRQRGVGDRVELVGLARTWSASWARYGMEDDVTSDASRFSIHTTMTWAIPAGLIVGGEPGVSDAPGVAPASPAAPSSASERTMPASTRPRGLRSPPRSRRGPARPVLRRAPS